MITVSVVSHGHGRLLTNLLSQLIEISCISKIIVTLNILEEIELPYSRKILLIQNNKSVGFSKNHNHAFKYCSTEYFCVINPDVSLFYNPFDILLTHFNDASVGLCAPCVIGKDNLIEENGRKFMSLSELPKRFLYFRSFFQYVIEDNSRMQPDWVAGMFMLFRSKAFSLIGGFDERYFLYCEDMDICMKLNIEGIRLKLVSGCFIGHDAQRLSHRQIYFLLLHCQSLFKYFLKWGFFSKN